MSNTFLACMPRGTPRLGYTPKLERLFRYIKRVAIANERVTQYYAEEILLQRNNPYQRGTNHIVLSPVRKVNSWDGI